MLPAPSRAAAVLTADADLRPALAELLHSPPARYPHAIRPVSAACDVLVREANNLKSTAFSPSTPSSNDTTDARHLARLAHAIEPCIDFLNLYLPQTHPRHPESRQTPLHHHQIHRIIAACHCAAAASAFALLQSPAFEATLPHALFDFLSFTRQPHVRKQANQHILQTLPLLVPALHALVELATGDALARARTTLDALMELLEEFSSLLQSPPSPHLTDFIQITISVIAFATCAGDPFPVQPSTVNRIRRLRQSLSTTPYFTTLICQDLDTLITRWSATPC